MKGTITIRIYLKDWRKLRKMFKAEQGESAAHYIERVMEELKND